MVARPFRCDESRLKSLLDDDMPELEQAELNDHLETCASCRRTLERLAAGSQLWAELRELAPVPSLDPASGRRTELLRSVAAGPGVRNGTTRSISSHRRTPRDRWAAWDRTRSPNCWAAAASALCSRRLTRLSGASWPSRSSHLSLPPARPPAAGSPARPRAAAAVVHDHVVAIHAVDSWNNLPYLVMPFVAGRSLQERVDRDGPMGVKEILRIGIQTARGLAAAHEQGLVHRDVKPSNILLENGVERVKLTDFGLARAVDDASLTQSGVVAGTPQYMSPEQARGEAVDHRSDLFSLGSVLYFMCTGHPPFRASSTPAVLRRVSDERPRPLREVNLDVPDWLAAIVDRLHEKDPAEPLPVGHRSRRHAGRPPGGPAARSADHGPAEGGGSASTAATWRKAMIAAAVMIPALALAVAAYYKPDGLVSLLPAMARPASAGASRVAAAIDQDANVTIIMNDGAKDRIVGSGVPAVKTWDIADFKRIEIKSTFRAEITKGSTFKVTTTADDNVLPHIRVVKEGPTLKISLASGSYELKSRPKAEITLPALVGLDVSGASKATLKGFQSENELTRQGLGLKCPRRRNRGRNL